MNINEILTFIAQVFFVALSTIALVDYFRHRNPRRRDFALLCCSLGLPLGVTLLEKSFDFKSPLFDLLGALALFSQPYFLFRLLKYYRPQPAWLHWLILTGMISCWAILFIFIASHPATIQLIIFGYSAIVDLYCTWEYSRGLRHTVGTLHRRLLYITVSSGLFTLALAGDAVNPLLPNLRHDISAIGLAITAISAVLYYAAFIPPRWMRHAWQYEDLRDFLIRTNPIGTNPTEAGRNRGAESFQYLTSTANQAVNGMMSAVIQRNESDGHWQLLEATNATLAPTVLANGLSVIEEAWQKRQPIAIYIPKMADSEKRRQMETVGAATWLLVPILATDYLWGLLLVLLRDRSLFIDDDLALLELLAQQSAILQENNRLITEMQEYSEQLERKIDDRTSELRQSEVALRELNATLEQRVEQRTSELQRSNSELDQFAYVASHDLKAPLRAITLLASWIEQDAGTSLPVESKEHLQKLQGRVRRMETLLTDLLAYSRVDRQRHPVEYVNIAELVHDVTEILAPPTGFNVKICGELPVMQVERIPLETVFRNLLGNAIKHHHHASEGHVEICTICHEEYIEFAVVDDGPGIAPEFHRRIFEIFQTLAPRDQVEGSGIGLAIVKKSVESRGGTIWIKSAEGEGTAIHFTWPRHLQIQQTEA